MALRVLAGVTSLLLVAAPAAAEDWEFIKDESGIKVEKKTIAGRSLPIFRGEGDVDASIIEILSVLNDTKRHTEWMHKCIDAERLLQVDDFNYLVYNRTDAPWPVWDRDVVVQSQVIIHESGDEVRTRFRAVRAKIKPEIEGVVRMTRLDGSWTFKRQTDALTHVVYQVDADPAGELPKWLAARVAEEIPFNTITNLREQVRKTRGEYDEFVAKWTQRMAKLRATDSDPKSGHTADP